MTGSWQVAAAVPDNGRRMWGMWKKILQLFPVFGIFALL